MGLLPKKLAGQTAIYLSTSFSTALMVEIFKSLEANNMKKNVGINFRQQSISKTYSLVLGTVPQNREESNF